MYEIDNNNISNKNTFTTTAMTSQLAWSMFTCSGNIGYYLLYKDLNNDGNTLLD